MTTLLDPSDHDVQMEAKRLRADHAGLSWDLANVIAHVSLIMRRAGVECFLTEDFR